MASLAGGTIVQLAPLALAAGVAYAISNMGQDTPQVKNAPVAETQRLFSQTLEDMKAWGASASFWQASHERLQNMGSSENKDLSLLPSQRPKTLEHMNWEHAAVAKFDTFTEMLAFDTRQGQLRMSKRNPIPDTLTATLVHPHDPSRVARFDTWHEMPHWANQEQVRQAEHILKSDTDPDNRMRRHYGVALFNRAPGQSFRYGISN